ncbi:2-amino-4-hydroxy-6-hydroxymethyldihydropteridine diphosphokinase [Tropicibacter sp. R15_0]|uniref:2-amino-4-hydroxy-6- hydroxymethyldihydropteridine diphosphokinase n=1 Tax=Tropicibacter sp. R15_0 TaxID=2821101 RepID=UPI001AD966D9|nr:2-amino-4-hydroxy-6-hydroxymethyldihydropteridine diphosphokinase [Tropicibacter sp. R15_0]MBO9468039.1 2-amino-4-hydroxy-6-hydroxymethyldihydropteridine diphosphokinase [Tropicibacter sp. R15_0]
MVQEYLIALGSNLGTADYTSLKTIQNCFHDLMSGSCKIRRVSRFFVTPCFPKGAGPDYINACAAVSFDGSPDAFLRHLHQIEAEFGRVRETRWAGRSLDLDLIAAGSDILPSQEIFDQWRKLPLDRQMREAPDQLVLPHPRLQDRAFVLVPLCDIAPNWHHPVLNQTVRELCDALPAEDRAEVMPINTV